jgi:hypothetical protein
MKAFDIQEIIQKHTNEVKEKVIPTMTEKVMDSFKEGFACGMEIGCTVIGEETIGWLFLQLNSGSIEVRDMDQLVKDYNVFIEAHRRKETQP